MAEERKRRLAQVRTPLVSAGTMLFNQVSGAGFGVFLAAYLKADIYGTINLTRSIFNVLLVLSPLGLDIALQRHIGGPASTPGVIAAEVLWTRGVAAALSTALLLATVGGGAVLLERTVFPHPDVAAVLIVMMIGLPFATDMAVIGGAQRGLNRAVTSLVAANVVQPAFRMACIVCLLPFVPGIWASVTGTAASYLVGWAFLAVMFHRMLPVRSGALREAMRPALSIFRYAPAMGVSMLLFSVARSLDTLFLGSFAAIEDVGRYGIAILIGQLVAMISTSLAQTIGTRFSAAAAAGDNGRLIAILSRNIRLSAVLCAPMCVVIALWGKDVDLLLGPSYRTPSIVFALVAATQYVQALSQNTGWPLQAAGRQNLELLNNALALAVQVVACSLLIPFFGIAGAGASTLLTLVCMAVFRQVQLVRVFGQRVVGREALTPLLVSAAVAGPLYAAYLSMPDRIWWVTGLFAVSALAASFAALVVFYGVDTLKGYAENA